MYGKWHDGFDDAREEDLGKYVELDDA